MLERQLELTYPPIPRIEESPDPEHNLLTKQLKQEFPKEPVLSFKPSTTTANNKPNESAK